MVHTSFRHLEKFVTEQYASLGIAHVAEDTFTIGKGARKLTIKYEPGDLIFFQMEPGTPSGYFKIDKNWGGPKLFLNKQPEPLHTDLAAEYLVRLCY